MNATYERRFYASKSGLYKARKRLGSRVVHWFQCNQGWLICYRVS